MMQFDNSYRHYRAAIVCLEVGGKAREGLPIPTVDLASPRGFEPLTYALGGHCAIQLCHGERLWSIQIAVVCSLLV